MSLSNNARIVTDGLVMYCDANNVKSYVGPPLKNILTQIAPTGIGSSTGYVATTGSETVNIPQIGDTFVNYVTIQNNYTVYTPNSNNCCPSLYQYGGGTLLPSTLYTYAIVYKCESGYTGANFMYQYDYNGATYVTEFGLHQTNQRIHLGGGWYWAWATFTTGSTVNTLNSSGLWYYQYSSGVDKVTVAKVMMVQGNYTTLHPKYWPALNTTRSNTQAIVDLTGNNTLTAASLTYASDGTFSFNGNASSNYIDCGNAASLQIAGAITIDAWVKPTAYTNLGNIVAKNGNSAYRFRLDATAGGLWWYVSGNAIQGGSAPLNTWSHLTVSGDSSGLYAYINGVLVASNATAYAPSAVAGGNLIIGALSAGSETFIGTITAVKMYNRRLSASEVAQNFNALRGRYGI